jgi:hypothetical protein
MKITINDKPIFSQTVRDVSVGVPFRLKDQRGPIYIRVFDLPNTEDPQRYVYVITLTSSSMVKMRYDEDVVISKSHELLVEF